LSCEKYSIDDLSKKFRDERINAICKVNGTLNVIVSGIIEDAKTIAREIFEITKEPIGIIKYSEENMSETYLKIKECLNAAKNDEKKIHIYNPKEDSLKALIEKELFNRY